MPRTELAFGTCYDLRGFRVSRKGIENVRQKTFKNSPKIELWALRGWIFDFLGGFLRGLIFDEFVICNNSAENQKKTRRRRKRAIGQQGSAAEAGSSRGFWSQQESASVSEKRPTRLVPLQAGGGGFEWLRHARRPHKYE